MSRTEKTKNTHMHYIKRRCDAVHTWENRMAMSMLMLMLMSWLVSWLDRR